MNNDYEVRGDITAIFLNRKDGSILEAIIDTVDLPIADSLNGKWYASWKDDTGFSVMGTTRIGKCQRKRMILHRLILNAPENLYVDHIDHNHLNNRRCNLRLATNAENQQNRNKPQSNNKTSGIIGVYWHRRDKRWVAKIKVNGKYVYLGCYKDKDEASEKVMKARAELMPFSQEALRMREGNFPGQPPVSWPGGR